MTQHLHLLFKFTSIELWQRVSLRFLSLGRDLEFACRHKGGDCTSICIFCLFFELQEGNLTVSHAPHVLSPPPTVGL